MFTKMNAMVVMKKTRYDYGYGYNVSINFHQALVDSGAIYADSITVEGMILRLKYVQEVWINHMCIVVLDLETNSPIVAKRRTEKFLEKLDRLLTRYGKCHKKPLTTT